MQDMGVYFRVTETIVSTPLRRLTVAIQAQLSNIFKTSQSKINTSYHNMSQQVNDRNTDSYY